ncbi:alpha/beta fold hydrolase [Pectinatus frisingensis]|jgi:pimeloyl-ACP methyl ester carboxylesterase|uniref:alpha/beta fold hydrolase n=1 Tax=Pectinatus frisingensis TaxID=865 RepID=UPI0015F5F578|nr:alpha/beta hydrolase [Pectinatus frisingensis]
MNRQSHYFTTKDGAKIYYEDIGNGHPIFFLHGWLCSSKFWQRNINNLAKNFRVIAMDLRGHGNSSKTLSGHTVDQYANDVQELIEYLDLHDLTLIGWSLGGPTVLSYWKHYSFEHRLKGLGLVDMTPYPFSPEDWNGHALRNYNADAMNMSFLAYQKNPRQYIETFVHKMFKDGQVASADMEWITAEMLKTPTAIGMAAYSDYLMSDYTSVLPNISIPVTVFSGEIGIYLNGYKQGQYIASCIPQGTFIGFHNAGHMLFYEQPEKFDQSVAKLAGQ